MKPKFYLLLCILGSSLTSPKSALAIEPQNKKQLLSEPQIDFDSVHYRKTLAKLEHLKNKRQKIREVDFLSFTWSGKTAAINYICAVKSETDCKNVLNWGLKDRAMVIRDHSLKIVLTSRYFLAAEKTEIAKNVVQNDKNYRNHNQLWIVDHAQEYLAKK